ncbi:MAG: hypothetical protein M1814_000872 [Vezdaea aestivalis]|nr:MAG: hypothetical protein M1814_000872 [Vezdaea aestivalis]
MASKDTKINHVYVPAGSLTTRFTPQPWCFSTASGDLNPTVFVPGMEGAGIDCYPDGAKVAENNATTIGYMSPARCPESYMPYTFTESVSKDVKDYVFTSGFYPAPGIADGRGCNAPQFGGIITLVPYPANGPTNRFTNTGLITVNAYSLQIRFRPVDISNMAFQSGELHSYHISLTGVMSSSVNAIITTSTFTSTSSSSIPPSAEPGINALPPTATSIPSLSSEPTSSPVTETSTTSPSSPPTSPPDTQTPTSSSRTLSPDARLVLLITLPLLSLLLLGSLILFSRQRAQRKAALAKPQRPETYPPRIPYAHPWSEELHAGLYRAELSGSIRGVSGVGPRPFQGRGMDFRGSRSLGQGVALERWDRALAWAIRSGTGGEALVSADGSERGSGDGRASHLSSESRSRRAGIVVRARDVRREFEGSYGSKQESAWDVDEEAEGSVRTEEVNEGAVVVWSNADS